MDSSWLCPCLCHNLTTAQAFSGRNVFLCVSVNNTKVSSSKQMGSTEHGTTTGKFTLARRKAPITDLSLVLVYKFLKDRGGCRLLEAVPMHIGSMWPSTEQ